MVMVGVLCASVVYSKRPRGSCRKELVVVKDSLVPGAGLGVFARKDIEKGTVLGQYPGIPRSDVEMAAKCMLAPMAREYCFLSRPGSMLDPTDHRGRPSTSPSPGLWWPFGVDVTLSYVNEPGKGSVVNVAVEDDPEDVEGLLFVADCDIRCGAEIYIDYGVNYDRSHYGY